MGALSYNAEMYPAGPYTALGRAGGAGALPPSDIKLPEFKKKNGADERTRTADLLITNQLLYQLSYVGLIRPEPGTETPGGRLS